MVVAMLKPLVNDTRSAASSITPPNSLYSENTPIAEFNFNAKNVKQIQNVLMFHTMAATIKKHPLKLIMMMSYIKYGINLFFSF